MKFSRIEPAYTSKHGCRLVWETANEDDSDTVILNKYEFESFVEILKKDATGKIMLEDQVSFIMVNSESPNLSCKITCLLKPILQSCKIKCSSMPKFHTSHNMFM